MEEKVGVEKQNAKKGFSKRMSMPAGCSVEGVLWVFGSHCPFKGGWSDSENSKLVKASTVLKVTSRSPGHAPGAYWHR